MGNTPEEHLNRIRDFFTELCAKVGYEFVIKLHPGSKGHRFHIKIYEKDLVVFETKKIRTQIPQDEKTGEQRIEVARSPGLDNLLDAINASLRAQGRTPLDAGPGAEIACLSWLLFPYP